MIKRKYPKHKSELRIPKFIVTEVLNFQPCWKSVHKFHTINSFMELLNDNQMD